MSIFTYKTFTDMKEWIKVLSDIEGLSEDEIHLLTDNQERKSFAKNEIVAHERWNIVQRFTDRPQHGLF